MEIARSKLTCGCELLKLTKKIEQLILMTFGNKILEKY